MAQVSVTSRPHDHLVYAQCTDPVIEVSVFPEHYTTLDIPSVNSFNFNCFISIPDYLANANITIRIELEGEVLKEMSTETSGPTSLFEVYFVQGLSAGTYEYLCLAILYIPEEHPRKYFAHFPVVIKGLKLSLRKILSLLL